MDTFLWWSGVLFWALFALIGLAKAIEFAIEWAVEMFGLYKDFAQFVWDDQRKRRAARKAAANT